MKSLYGKMVGLTVSILLGALFVTSSTVMAKEEPAAQEIVDRAKVTLNSFMRDKNYTWLQKNFKNAKGVLIYPQIIKGGFVLGGSGGTGVFLIKDAKTGDWSQPAFYTVGAMSFGFQAGAESAETIMLIMTRKAIDSLFTSKVKLGGDTSLAVGPVGGGADASIKADFISFSKSKGLYGGLNLEGSVVGVRDSLNKSYYGKDLRPVQILVEKNVSNKGTAELRAALKKAAK